MTSPWTVPRGPADLGRVGSQTPGGVRRTVWGCSSPGRGTALPGEGGRLSVQVRRGWRSSGGGPSDGSTGTTTGVDFEVPGGRESDTE